MSKARTALEEMGKDGSFKRKESAWRNWISDGRFLLLCVLFLLVFSISFADFLLLFLLATLKRRELNFHQQQDAITYLWLLHAPGRNEHFLFVA